MLSNGRLTLSGGRLALSGGRLTLSVSSFGMFGRKFCSRPLSASFVTMSAKIYECFGVER